MATQREELEPDFLRMDGPHGTATPADGLGTGQNMGWPSRNVAQPKTIVDDHGRITRIRTPVMDLDGLMTPTYSMSSNTLRFRNRSRLRIGGSASMAR